MGNLQDRGLTDLYRFRTVGPPQPNRSRRAVTDSSPGYHRFWDIQKGLIERSPFDPAEIEPGILPLVVALNSTGLFETFSSCEGHFGEPLQCNAVNMT